MGIQRSNCIFFFHFSLCSVRCRELFSPGEFETVSARVRVEIRSQIFGAGAVTSSPSNGRVIFFSLLEQHFRREKVNCEQNWFCKKHVLLRSVTFNVNNCWVSMTWHVIVMLTSKLCNCIYDPMMRAHLSKKNTNLSPILFYFSTTKLRLKQEMENWTTRTYFLIKN